MKYRQALFRPNEDKFPEYFLYDAILNDETLFKDIHGLPTASLRIYEDGTLTKNQYFDFSTFSEEISLGKEEFHKEANRIFKKIMPVYVTGDRNISTDDFTDMVKNDILHRPEKVRPIG